MEIVRRNRVFLLTAAMILGVGALLFGSVVAVRVLAAEAATTPPPAATTPVSYNTVSSYGTTGYETLTVTPTAETPKFVSNRLAEKRGVILFVYCQGAADDMEMLSHFKDLKKKYSSDSSFMSFESKESKELGDMLMQLHVTDPPILAIIKGDGTVAQLYTGFIDYKVMEQQIADAVRF